MLFINHTNTLKHIHTEDDAQQSKSKKNTMADDDDDDGDERRWRAKDDGKYGLCVCVCNEKNK